MKKLLYIIAGLLLITPAYIPTAQAAKSGQVNDVSPKSIKPGDTVTITGSGFGNTQSTSYVCFGSSCAYSSTNTQSWTDGQIVLILPSYITSAGATEVHVSNFTEGLFYTATGPTTYIAPKLSSVTPKITYPNQEVTLSCGSVYSLASCFGDARGSVLIGGQSASIKSWSSYSIVVYVPNMSAGTYDVLVANPANGQSDPQGITILAAPTMYSITPTQVVPGVTNLCISGQNFGTTEENWSGQGANSELTIGGVAVTRAGWTDTKICFDVPATVKQSGTVNLKIRGYQVPGSQSYSIGTPTVPNTGQSTGGTKPNDTDLSKQYYLSQINAFNGWTQKSSSEDVIVAVIDEGIYINHPEFQGSIWTNPKEQIGNNRDDDGNGYVDDIYGWDFLSNGGEMTVRGSHGTHVAGIIGALGNNNQGIAGISWKTKLMSLIACDPKAGCPTTAVVKAIRYAVDNGAQVINMSLGSFGTTGFSIDFDDAIKYAYNKGVVIVAAAGNGDTEGASLGNSGLGQDTGAIPQSPVCNDNSQNMVIGVGSVDDQNIRTRWSNFGSCVDVYAPGKGIYSTGVPQFDNTFFSAKDGTSFSAPMVSGLAALVIAKNPGIPNSEVRNRIMRNVNTGVIDVSKTLQDSTAYTPQVITTGGGSAHTIGVNVKSSDGTIYLISADGTRRPYTSGGAFLSYGFNSFASTVNASTADMGLPAGSFIPPRDGKIICSDRGSDKGTCYLITNSKKAGFTSAAVFQQLGFSFKTSTAGDVSWMESTGNIDDGSAAHRSGVLINNAGTYQITTDGGLLGIPNGAILASWGYSFGDAIAANSADKVLKQIGVLRSRSQGELLPSM